MRRFRNITLKVTACIMVCALIVSVIWCQVDSLWLTALCIGSATWLGLFAYANL